LGHGRGRLYFGDGGKERLGGTERKGKKGTTENTDFVVGGKGSYFSVRGWGDNSYANYRKTIAWIQSTEKKRENE